MSAVPAPKRRSEASKRGWVSRKRLAAARAAQPEPGTAKGDYSIPELLERIRARGESGAG